MILSVTRGEGLVSVGVEDFGEGIARGRSSAYFQALLSSRSVPERWRARPGPVAGAKYRAIARRGNRAFAARSAKEPYSELFFPSARCPEGLPIVGLTSSRTAPMAEALAGSDDKATLFSQSSACPAMVARGYLRDTPFVRTLERSAVHMKKSLLPILLAATALAAPPTYKIVGKIKIGGVGRWDYSYSDSANHRLYISHGTQTEVVDTCD